MQTPRIEYLVDAAGEVEPRGSGNVAEAVAFGWIAAAFDGRSARIAFDPAQLDELQLFGLFRLVAERRPSRVALVPTGRSPEILPSAEAAYARLEAYARASLPRAPRKLSGIPAAPLTRRGFGRLGVER